LCHVIGDIIQSIGVVIASIIILIWPEAKIVDPIITLLFAILVMFTTVGIFRDNFNILMEGVPKEINYYELNKELKNAATVIVKVEDLHVWCITPGKIAATCHIKVKSIDRYQRLLLALTIVFRKFDIYHSTIQIEYSEGGENGFILDCRQNIHKSIPVPSLENKNVEIKKIKNDNNEKKAELAKNVNKS